ncbi:MAG TPA: hypothetical protein VF796_17555 [Humisphaera sp.]
MGGPGSGYRLDKKTTVEDCIVLSAAAMTRIGLLRANLHRAGSVTWTNTVTGEKVSAIGFDPNVWDEHGSARLHYTRTRTGDQVDYRVQVTSTPLPWGGRRWWFGCPLVAGGGAACGRRCGKLYLPPGARYFGCRRCYELTYESSQEAHKNDRWAAELGREYGLSARDVLRSLAGRDDRPVKKRRR